MKVFLDDNPQISTPEGWVRAWDIEEAKTMLLTGQVTHLCFDHDLGQDAQQIERENGYQLAKWIEERIVFHAPPFQDHNKIPVFTIHSQNSVGVENIGRVLDWIDGFVRGTRLFKK